jgi:hypothetical protein
MNRLFIMVHLDAKGAPGEGMFRVSGDLDGFPILYFNQKPARVGAIIGTYGTL